MNVPRTLVLAILPSSLAPVHVQDVSFAADMQGAFERAESESKRVLLAVMTAGEARAEDFVKRVHRDRSVKALLAETVPVLALLGDPTKAEARRFGGHELDTHRALALACRDRVPANAEGVIASPQHVWFDASGRVLVSAPFELEPEELAWLDWRSKGLAGDAAAVLPAGARAPRRYLEGEIYVPPNGDRFGRGLLEAEMVAELDVLRKRSLGGGGRNGGGGGGGGWSREAIDAIVRLAMTDHPDAQEQVRQELGNVFLRFGGATFVIDSGLEIVAYHAPLGGAETALVFVSDTSAGLRARAAAALEALGFPDGFPALKKAYDKEEDPAARRAQLRALGVAGRGQAAARRLLEKEAARAKDPLDRCAALIGLGHLGDAEACEPALRAALAESDPRLALAAAAAMALTRDAARFRDSIVARAEGVEAEAAPAFEAALAVLDGAPLARAKELVELVAGDAFARPRLFFRAIPSELIGAGAFQRGGRGGEPGSGPGGDGGNGPGGGPSGGSGGGTGGVASGSGGD